MAQIKKDAKRLNIKLNREIHEELERFCDESGMTKTAAIEKILAQYLERYFKKPETERNLFQ